MTELWDNLSKAIELIKKNPAYKRKTFFVNLNTMALAWDQIVELERYNCDVVWMEYCADY